MTLANITRMTLINQMLPHIEERIGLIKNIEFQSNFTDRGVNINSFTIDGVDFFFDENEIIYVDEMEGHEEELSMDNLTPAELGKAIGSLVVEDKGYELEVFIEEGEDRISKELSNKLKVILGRKTDDDFYFDGDRRDVIRSLTNIQASIILGLIATLSLDDEEYIEIYQDLFGQQGDHEDKEPWDEDNEF